MMAKGMEMARMRMMVSRFIVEFGGIGATVGAADAGVGRVDVVPVGVGTVEPDVRGFGWEVVGGEKLAEILV
jgi:hypothetical protein